MGEGFLNFLTSSPYSSISVVVSLWGVPSLYTHGGASASHLKHPNSKASYHAKHAFTVNEALKGELVKLRVQMWNPLSAFVIRLQKISFISINLVKFS